MSSNQNYSFMSKEDLREYEVARTYELLSSSELAKEIGAPSPEDLRLVDDDDWDDFIFLVPEE